MSRANSSPADTGEFGTLAPVAPGTGLIARPQRDHLTPALQAEQQRAKSEIEAALTIAQARPRDQVQAIDRITTACQRPLLAEQSQYQYSKGGTAISGASIKLLEVVAQNWGNLEFGFRELARYPGVGGQPGESVVEAYAWDLETNTRRRTQFTVQHAMKSGDRVKTITDPRDIYEYIANQAQRRVRTCLENIIPRDVVEQACEECDRTLRAKVDVTPEGLKKLVAAFDQFLVTKDQIEARIQRRLEAITPAQVLGLKKIWASLRDGMSDVADWFEPSAKDEPPKPAKERAKDALKKRAAEKGADPFVPPAPASDPQSEAQGHAQDVTDIDADQFLADTGEMLAGCQTLLECDSVAQSVSGQQVSDALKQRALALVEQRKAVIRGNRGERGQRTLMDTAPQDD